MLDTNEDFQQKTQEFIAHIRASDGAEQPLYDHLTGTAEISKRLATKIGLPLSGELIGLVHDLGKYSQAFQTYIRKCVQYDNYKKLGLHLDEDEEAEPLPNGKPKRGSVDHSTAGAIYLLKQFQTLSSTIIIKSSQKKVNVEQGQLLADILFICVASHHSGMVNVVDKDHNYYLDKRKKKDEKDSHYQESLNNATTNHLFTHLDKNINNATISEFSKAIKRIINDNTNVNSIAQDKL